MRLVLLTALLGAGCTIRSEPQEDKPKAAVSLPGPSADAWVPGSDRSAINAFSRKLLAMQPQDRRVLFGRLVEEVGGTCNMADEAVFRGSAPGVDVWRARCPNQQEWSIGVYPAGATKVMSCAAAEKAGAGCHESMTKNSTG